MLTFDLLLAVFKKMDSISDDVNSAQAYYEKKLESVQENLQELGKHEAIASAFHLCSGDAF